MAWLRAKTCVFVLFGLITFGQAYPYSYAWAEGRHAECGCNNSGRKCIHGCDLKKKRSAPDHHDHAAMGHDSRSHWVNPDCSKQKQREVLDFRGDPFVPQMVSFFLPSRVADLVEAAGPQPIQRSFLPDPPPPKA